MAADLPRIATLRNGFTIRFQAREDLGATSRLYLNSDGYVEVLTADIVSVEVEEVIPPPASATPPDPVLQAGERHQLDPDFLRSVIRAESGGNPRAVSSKGAQGLMQLMPSTAASLGVRHPLEPVANVDAGARYLRQLLELFNDDMVKALAAYNAGPGRVQQFGGVPPYRETRAYVSKVVRDFNKKKLAEKKARSSGGSRQSSGKKAVAPAP